MSGVDVLLLITVLLRSEFASLAFTRNIDTGSFVAAAASTVGNPTIEPSRPWLTAVACPLENSSCREETGDTFPAMSHVCPDGFNGEDVL